MDTLKKWLKHNLDKLTNVNRCTFGLDPAVSDPIRKADMVVHMWAGIHVHIHILDAPLHLRTIKRIVENATQVAVCTLFLVDLRLLPKAGERVSDDKWFLAIQALTDNRVYAYFMSKNGPVIRQVHFDRVGMSNEYQTRHGPEVEIKQFRCYRNSVKAKILKGFWMVADFGPDAAKKAANGDYQPYANYERLRRESVNNSQTPPHTNGQNQQTTSSNNYGAHPQKKSKLEVCYEMLGIKRESSRDEVKAAFRKLAFAVHPDVSDLPQAEAEARFKALSEAYEYIKSVQGWV
jgi:hypothetical protein